MTFKILEVGTPTKPHRCLVMSLTDTDSHPCCRSEPQMSGTDPLVTNSCPGIGTTRLFPAARQSGPRPRISCGIVATAGQAMQMMSINTAFVMP